MLNRSRQAVAFQEDHFRAVISCGLRIAGSEPLGAQAADHTPSTTHSPTQYTFPAIDQRDGADPTWAATLDALRKPRGVSGSGGSCGARSFDLLLLFETVNRSSEGVYSPVEVFVIQEKPSIGDVGQPLLRVTAHAASPSTSFETTFNARSRTSEEIVQGFGTELRIMTARAWFKHKCVNSMIAGFFGERVSNGLSRQNLPAGALW